MTLIGICGIGLGSGLVLVLGLVLVFEPGFTIFEVEEARGQVARLLRGRHLVAAAVCGRTIEPDPNPNPDLNP